MPNNDDKGYVYIATNDTYESKDTYKVGHTKNLKPRMKNFQTFSPDSIKVLYAHETDNKKALEKSLHNLLNCFNAQIRGEWYQLSVIQLKNIIDFMKCAQGRNVTEEIIDTLPIEIRAEVAQNSAETIQAIDRLQKLKGEFHLIGNLRAILLIKDGRYTIQKGSHASVKTAPCLETGTYRRVLERRNALIQSGVMVKEGIHYIFTVDYVVENVSMAANIVSGQWRNGRDVWVNSEEKSINQLIKKEE